MFRIKSLLRKKLPSLNHSLNKIIQVSKENIKRICLFHQTKRIQGTKACPLRDDNLFTQLTGQFNMAETWDEKDDIFDFEELEEELKQMVDRGCMEELLKTQLLEYEMLVSMFSNPGELCIDDYSVLADFHDYIGGKSSVIPPQLDFTINLNIETYKLEVCINLPLEYPNVEPDIFLRSEKLCRTQQRALNKELTNYLSALERGETCICSAIGWLQENALEYFNRKSDETPKEVNPKQCQGNEFFNRLWIYSHHIYSKVKRREIMDLALEYRLTGFCLPGRPGIICIEGHDSDCEEWWQKVRNMHWKKIMCKRKEEIMIDCPDNIDKLRKFSDFKELALDSGKSKKRDFHMDFGEFYKFLSNHKCEYAFRDYFGFDGK